MRSYTKGISSKGFTLMELLIVIAIIAILISVATASYSSAQSKSRNSRRTADMKSIQSGMEQYYSQVGAYPASGNCGELTSTATYLPAGWPDDPKPSTNYTIACSIGASGVDYCACARLEPNGNSIGNAGTSACGGYGASGTGEYFCVRQLQ